MVFHGLEEEQIIRPWPRRPAVILNESAGGGNVDSDATDIIDNMPEEPTQSEKRAINDFVLAEKAAGNWDAYDYILSLGLTAEANALHDWIGNKNAVNNGCTQIAGGMQAANTLQYLQTGWIQNIDAANYQQNLAHCSLYNIEIPADDLTNIQRALTGWLESGSGNLNQTFFGPRYSGGGVTLDYVINGNNQSIPVGVPLDNSLWTVQRTGPTESALLIDGVGVDVTAGASVGPSALEPYIFCRNLNDAPNAQPQNQRSAAFYSLGGALTDTAAHFTNIEKLYNDLL